MRLFVSRIGQWLILGDYGPSARRHMMVGWTCVAVLTLVVSVWLPLSRLSLDQAAWPALAHFVAYGAAAYLFCLTVDRRLRKADDRISRFLAAALERLALLFRSCLLVAAIGGVGLIFSYLATAAALPLRDAFLAQLDGQLGFHWLWFLRETNDLPFAADLLVKSYRSTAPLTQGVLIWLAICGRGERLAEFLALLCLSSVGLAAGMLFVPAAGAFAYFEPARQSFDNFTAAGEMWPFLKDFNGLRDGSLTSINILSVQGVVSFPSFHTMLGVITTYALRDTRALLIPAIALNAMMIVATLPVGGHYLVDVLAGAAITVFAIYGLRYRFGPMTISRLSLSATRRSRIGIVLSSVATAPDPTTWPDRRADRHDIASGPGRRRGGTSCATPARRSAATARLKPSRACRRCQ